MLKTGWEGEKKGTGDGRGGGEEQGRASLLQEQPRILQVALPHSDPPDSKAWGLRPGKEAVKLWSSVDLGFSSTY